MSKIEELLDRIRDTLAGTDQSDTPQLRKLAETYAAACRTVNTELSACREMIGRGLWADAARHNDSAHPAWSRRAVILAFPERESWIELCRMYNYPTAELDLETVQLLEDPPENGKAFNKLIMQWRKIARAGQPGEKVKLLRRIVAAAPEEGATLWRGNLAAAEKSYRKELLTEAERALRAGSMTDLQTRCAELTDPAWLEPVPAAELAPFQQALQEHQQKEFRRTVKEQLDRLGAAYSTLDPELVRSGLAEWDKLTTHPFFSASDDELRQVAEVREFLEESDARKAQEREGREKTLRLIMELDRHGDFNQIENLYEALRQSDFPIDETLARRVEIRRTEFQDAERRRHKLRCFLVASVTILLLALGGAAIFFYQYHRASLRYRAGMQEQLDSRNYDAVLELYKQAEAENPRLVTHGNLADLKAEAERRKARFLEDEEQYRNILNELDGLWKSSTEPPLARLRAKLAELDKLEPEHRSAELREAGRRHHNRCQALAEQLQQRRDEAFLAEVRTLENDCNRLQKVIRGQASSRSDQEIAELRRRTAALAAQGSSVSPEVRDGNLANLKLQLDNLSRTAGEVRKHETILNALTHPRDWDTFCTALSGLPEQAPELAQGEWRRALTLLPLFRAVAQSALLGGQWESRELFLAQSAAVRALAPTNPILEDIERLLPPEGFTEQVEEQLKSMRKLGAGASCELVFRTEDNKVCRFYPAAPPKMEQRTSSQLPKSLRLPKSLSFQYVPSYGGTGVTIVFRIPRPVGSQVVFEPVRTGPLTLPKSFTELTHADLVAGKFPPPEHTQFLTRADQRLKQAGTSAAQLEKETLEQLKALKQASGMNPFIRLAILDHLLKLLTRCSMFYVTPVAPLQIAITRLGPDAVKNWNSPTEALDHPETVDAIEQCFADLDPERLHDFAARCRDLHLQALDLAPTPAAVVTGNAREGFRLHWFRGMEKCAEVFLPVLNEDDSAVSGFLRIARDEFGRDDRLPDAYSRRACSGMVVFAPQPGSSAAERLKTYLKTTGAGGVAVWPASWPQNFREVKP